MGTNSGRVVNTLECYMDDLVDCFEDFIQRSLIIISMALGALVIMLGYMIKMVTERSQNAPLNNYNTGMASTRTNGTPGNYSQTSIKPFPSNNLNLSLTAKIRRTKSNVTQKSENTPQISDSKQQQSDSTQRISDSAHELSDYTNRNSEPKADTCCLKKECHTVTATNAKTNPMSTVPSSDEKVLKEIGLSGSGSCSKRPIAHNYSTERTTIPSLPSCFPNHHLSAPRQCSKYIALKTSCCSMCCADDDRR